MSTLDSKLGQTTHYSVLLRKARRLGLNGPDDFMKIAVDRGCHHFQGTFQSELKTSPDENQLSDEELAVLLLHGGNAYSPMAIRCAAQLLKKPGLNLKSLGRLARMERVETPLHDIAEAGLRYDSADPRWGMIARSLCRFSTPPEAVLPAHQRYLIMAGRKRHSSENHPARWLSPTPQ